MVDYKSLIGKQWEYGRNDCYSLLREYYKKLGIELPDFERPENLGMTDSLFLRYAKSLNFVPVDFEDRKPNDVLLMRLATRTPMHAAVYLGNDKILHQRADSVSTVEPLRGYYRKRIAAVFRHAAGFTGG